MSGLSHCAGVVLADKQVGRVKHIEFVPLDPGRALVVLVGDDQSVENRVIALPPGLPASALTEATNYLNAHARGLSIEEARGHIEQQLVKAKARLTAVQADLRREQADFDEIRDQVAAAVVAQYQSQGLSTAGQVLLSDDPDAFLSQLQTVSAYNERQGAVLKQFTVRAKQLALRKEAAQRQIDEIARTEKALTCGTPESAAFAASRRASDGGDHGSSTVLRTERQISPIPCPPARVDTK